MRAVTRRSPTYLGDLDGRRGRSRSALIIVASIAFLPLLVNTLGGEMGGYQELLASGVWLVCLVPAYAYLKKPASQRKPVPFFEIISLEYGIYFALPVALNYASGASITGKLEEYYTFPIGIAAVGIFSFLGAYLIIEKVLRPEEKRQDKTADISEKQWGVLLVLAGFTAEALLRSGLYPSLLHRAIFLVSRISWVGVGLLFLATYKNRAGYVVLGVALALVIIPTLTTGQSATYVKSAVGVGLALWVVKRRFNVQILIGVVLLIFVTLILRAGKDHFRSIAWLSPQSYSTVERLSIYTGFVERTGLYRSLERGVYDIRSRTSYISVFSDVVYRTPREVPFWAGETYYPLLYSVVPRFLVPGKPSKNTGIDFGHRYGYILPSDTRTSINMPYMVEGYANFGFWGVVVSMLLAGMIHGVISARLNCRGQDVLKSFLLIVLIIPLFNIETSSSLTFGGLLLDGVALWLIYKSILAYPHPFGYSTKGRS